MHANKEPSEVDWDQRARGRAKAAPTSASTNDIPNQRLIVRAGIKAGDHILDLASGTGEPAISIALKVGDEGSVIATDTSAEMLKVAKSRAQKLNLDNIRFEICRMEDLPFEDDCFDAVTCRFGIMLCDDAVAALAGTRRVLKPDRRMAVMVHDEKEQNTVVRAAVFAFLGEEDKATEIRRFRFGGPGELGEEDKATEIRRFRFGGPGELTELFEAAGFTGVKEEQISEIVTRPAGQQFRQQMVGRAFGEKVAALDADQRAALDGEIQGAFEPYRDGDEYRLRSTVRVAWGKA